MNANFIDSTLKESKQKIKKMLMSKMGREAVEQLGCSQAEAISGVEENTQISSLCDLIERIWSHGKATTGSNAVTAAEVAPGFKTTANTKSALWQHLVLYRQRNQSNQDLSANGKSAAAVANSQRPYILGGTLDRQKFRLGSLKAHLRNAVDPIRQKNDVLLGSNGSLKAGAIPSGELSRSETDGTRLKSNIADNQPLRPSNVRQNSAAADANHIRALLRDIKHVTHSVVSIKSSVGLSRAFLRLSLEKKLLAQHLKTLLSDPLILNEIYKPYAFLLSEDEREQFLYHVLSLNAVDYFCFTNTYLDTPMPMTIGVTATGSSSASLWAALCGTHCRTDRFCIPRGAFNYTVKPKNIGLIELVKIGLLDPSGSDDAQSMPNVTAPDAIPSSLAVVGVAARLFVDEVTIQNQITGHVYRFACHRWLGRGVDDDATERWLIGRRVSLAATPSSSGAAMLPDAKDCWLRISDDVDEELQAEQSAPSARSSGVVGSRQVAMPGSRFKNTTSSSSSISTTNSVVARGRSVDPTAGGDGSRMGGGSMKVWPLAADRRSRSPSMPRRIAYEDRLTTSQVERLLGESANVLVKHFHHAQIQPSNVNGTLRARSSNVGGGDNNEHAYVNPFVLLCRPNGFVSRFELALHVGFRSSRFSLWEGTKQVFLWDFIERVAQHFILDVLKREKLNPTTRAAVEQFCTLVRRLDENAATFGKDGKFRLFVCLSLRDKVLSRNVELMSRTPSINDMFDEPCLLRNKESKMWLIKLLDSLSQYNIFIDTAFTKGL